MSDTTPEQVIEAAKKKWRRRKGFTLSQPTLYYSRKGYPWLDGEHWSVGGQYELAMWPKSKPGGDYLPITISAPTLPALLAKIKGTSDANSQSSSN